LEFKKKTEATDEHRSEGVAKKPAFTQQVKDFFHKNLCSSVALTAFLRMSCPCQSDPGALRRRSRHGQAAPPLICQSNRGKNLKMPKMPKSVQFRPEPDFSTPPAVPRSAGFAAGQMGQTDLKRFKLR
jgi:hypothetical protein